MKILFLFSFMAVASYAEVAFQEPIRIEAPLSDENPSEPVFILHEAEIRRSSSVTVADLLRDIPGVEVAASGGAGQTVSVFLRGARSEDTLVLIDGIRANEPLSPAGGFDFSGLAPDHLERIEVHRGPQGVRFGAGALGGVIHFITKEGKGKSSTALRAEAGSFETRRVSVGWSGGREEFGVSTGIGLFETGGFSAAAESDGNTESDGARLASGLVKLSWRPGSVSRIEGVLHHGRSDVEIDNGGGPGGDDPNNEVQSERNLAGISAERRFGEGKFRSALALSRVHVKREGRNLPDQANGTDSRDFFESEARKARFETEMFSGEVHTVRWGIEGQEEHGSAESVYDGFESRIASEKLTSWGGSASYLFASPTWFLDLGAREDRISTGESAASRRLSLGRRFPDRGLKIHLTYGSGFKWPSLYQLYSVFGDRFLRPEGSDAFEVVVEASHARAIETFWTVFENRFRDLIDFNTATSSYFNVARARSRGIEGRALFSPMPSVRLEAAATSMETEDLESGQPLLRRPKFSGALALMVRDGRHEATLRARYKGEREDLDPLTFQRTRLNGYETLEVEAGRRFGALSLRGRIENVLDRRYEEIAGYGTPGTSLYLGLSGEL